MRDAKLWLIRKYIYIRGIQKKMKNYAYTGLDRSSRDVRSRKERSSDLLHMRN